MNTTRLREAAGMFNVSPLKKVFVHGHDAVPVLDHLPTRAMGRTEFEVLNRVRTISAARRHVMPLQHLMQQDAVEEPA
jgi:hypothetical protein